MSSQRTFLITGATEGIGHATADRVARAGHRVVGPVPTQMIQPFRVSRWPWILVIGSRRKRCSPI